MKTFRILALCACLLLPATTFAQPAGLPGAPDVDDQLAAQIANLVLQIDELRLDPKVSRTLKNKAARAGDAAKRDNARAASSLLSAVLREFERGISRGLINETVAVQNLIGTINGYIAQLNA